MILDDFFANRIRIRFIEADPDPADQNEIDPNRSGSATLQKNELLRFVLSFYLCAFLKVQYLFSNM